MIAQQTNGQDKGGISRRFTQRCGKRSGFFRSAYVKTVEAAFSMSGPRKIPHQVVVLG
jgi:hypothetical protein